MLQVLLGADDHTASEGSYLRAVKARKWVYLTAAIAALLAHRLYNEAATGELLKVLSLPYWLLSQVAGFGLLYLTIQYVLLLIQLRSVYDLELDERFAAKLKAEREAATSGVEGATSNLRNIDREIARIEGQLSGLIPGVSTTSEHSALQSQLQANEANRESAALALDTAIGRLSGVDGRDPSKRALFVQTERLIDYLRLTTPVIVSVATLTALTLAQF